MKALPSLSTGRSRRVGGFFALCLTAFFGLAHSSLAQTQFDLIPLSSAVWRYDDTNADRGTAWREFNYPEEVNWRSGLAMFGVEPTVPYPYPAAVSTPLVLGANRITYYFRTHFQVTNTPSTLVAEASAYVDDGAVFYVNGIEVGRVRVQDNPATHTSRALLNYPEGLAYNWTLPSSALVQGENVLAVEVHQNDSTSSDVLFGLGLRATVAMPPIILTLNEPSDRTVTQGRPTTFTVMGDGIPAPTYQWYRNGTPVQNDANVSGATSPSLHISSFTAGDAGQYHVVLTNAVGAATSRVAQVMYEADTTPPAILYAIWRDAQTFEAVLSDALEPFSATDTANYALVKADGTGALNINRVDLLNGTNAVFSTDARDTAVAYVLSNAFDVYDPWGNFIPAGTLTHIAGFTNSLVSLTNQSWRYENSGADPGPTWLQTTFNDAAWAQGFGLFDVFRANPASVPVCRTEIFFIPDPIQTCFPSLSNAPGTAPLSAVYFRTHFQFAGNPTNSVLRLRALLDDGAVIYLNGVELFRPGMPAGSVLYSTLANRVVGNPVYETFEFATSALVVGDNVLAVEIHQDSLIGDDLTFGLELIGILPEPPPQQQANAATPRLNAVARLDNIDIAWAPAAGRLQSAATAAGPWQNVAAVQPGTHLESMNGAKKFFRVVVP